MILSRSFHPDDYSVLMTYVDAYKRLLARGVPAQINHKHRAWEYALALKFLALQPRRPQRILDIGGGGSLFAPLANLLGHDVTVMDGSRQARQIPAQNVQLGTNVKLVNDYFSLETFIKNPYLFLGDFDAIVAISVIEHVEDDQQFLYDMLDLGADTIFLTTDFSTHGNAVSGNHLRTYTPEGLRSLATSDIGWKLYRDEEDWTDKGAFVYTYNFASMALCTN